VSADPVRALPGEALPPGEITRFAAPDAPELEALVYVPPARSAGPLPVVVAVHGISRNAREQAEAFAPGAGRRGLLVVAPRFTERAWPDYQRLGRRGRGPRADIALERLLAALRDAGLASDALHLFGYSGGGQFVHRFALTHPERVRGAAVAAAGWYTFPDPAAAYPHGLRVDGDLPGVRFRPRAFLQVPVLVAVGEEDRVRDESLRRSRAVDRRQGRQRVARARRWVGAMRRAARERGLPPRVELSKIAGVGHSFGDCVAAGLDERVLDFFTERRAQPSNPEEP